MKKIIPIILALVMLLSFSACDSKVEKEPSTVKPVEMDIEELRSDWRDGVLTFADGGKADLPCTMDEIVESSGLKIADAEGIKKKVLQPDENANFNLVGDDIQIRLTFKNKTDEPLTADKAPVVSYNYTNLRENNGTIRFANSLTMNVKRADVENSLGVPDGATPEDTMYTYVGRDSEKRRVELRVTFNSNNLVNSVAFHVGAK